MNIIKRIGVALSVVLLDSVTKNQAKEITEAYRNEFGVTIDNQQFNEMQRRCDKLSYIEGVGYTLNTPLPELGTKSEKLLNGHNHRINNQSQLPNAFNALELTNEHRQAHQSAFNPALASQLGQAIQPSFAPVKEPRPINRNNRRGSVQDFVLHCINGLPSRYYTSIDVWREYQLLNGPKTTRGTVLACVTHLRESGVIQAANPPRKLGTKIVHQK